MAISNLERKVRFSKSAIDYVALESEQIHKMLPILMENKEFVATLEAKKSYVMPKQKLHAEATKLSSNPDPVVASCGKAILQFLAGGVQTIDAVLITISSVLLAGGVILSTCIVVIVAFILYAVTVIPPALLIAALGKQYKSLGDYLDKSKDPNVKQYKTLTTNIMNQKDGVKDVHELSKVTQLSEAVRCVIECDGVTPDANPEIHNCCGVLRAIDSRIDATQQEDDAISLEMAVFGDLAPSHYVYESNGEASILEAMFDPDNDDLEDGFFEAVLKYPLLSGEGLLEGVICSVTGAISQNSIMEFLNRYRDTVTYELTHERYRDLPILRASCAALEYAYGRCADNDELSEEVASLDQMFAHIVDEAYNKALEDASQGGAPVVCTPSTTATGFTPDPFNIGNLTPFPVASRKVGEVVCDVCKASNDEELTEAMLKLARVSTVISENYVVEETDSGFIFMESEVGKAARRASDKAQQQFAKSATKDKTEGPIEAVKRTIDPMEKFIQKQYDTLKEKDANERRNIILKGGAMPKVLRWVKRGIGLLVGGMVGSIIPPVAIVTGIVFLGYIATDKYLDHKERAKLLRELEDEIQICNEKIDDSRGDDDKQKKYELMRIRNQLTRTSEKIRLGLKY